MNIEQIVARMQRIENRDADYTKNKTWKRLKGQQDTYYRLVAQKRLKDHEVRYEQTHGEFHRRKIEFYKSYLANSQKIKDLEQINEDVQAINFSRNRPNYLIIKKKDKEKGE